MEYYTTSVLNYLEYTLANVGLSKADLKWDSNDATKIENKYIKHMEYSSVWVNAQTLLLNGLDLLKCPKKTPKSKSTKR